MNKLIFGRRSQGKTTLGMFLARESGKDIIVFDVRAEFQAWPESVVNGPEELLVALESQRFDLLVYRPTARTRRWEEFDQLAEILWDREGYTLIVDEAHNLQTAAIANEWLDAFVRERNLDTVDVIQTLHAPADAYARFRSIANDWYIFHTTREADLRAIASQSSDEVAQKVLALEPHHFIHWNDDEQRAEESGDPKGWFVELKPELAYA